MFDANNQRLAALLGPVGFLVAQRFYIPEGVVILPLAPMIASLIFFNDRKLFNSLVFLALFFSVDIGLPGLPATPTPVRYSIYLLCFFALIRHSIFSTLHVTLFLLYSVFLLLITVTAKIPISSGQLVRDLTILVLAFVVFTQSQPKFELDHGLIAMVVTCFMVSELVNIYWFRDLWIGEYLSYDSTKFVVVFAAFTQLFRRSKSFLPLLLVTEAVLVGYTSRNIFLLFNLLVAVQLGLLFFSMKHRWGAFFLLVAGTAVLIAFASMLSEAEVWLASKPRAMLIMFVEMSFTDALINLDRVRYFESVMFFQQPFLLQIFGSGFGAGISDTAGYLDFVQPIDTAFSDAEIHTGIFYNFHDFWVDIGLRFGLLPLACVFLFIASRGVKTGRIDLALMAVTSICIGFFSVAGLMVSAFMIMSLKSE